MGALIPVDAVRRWRDRLRAVDVADRGAPLSPEGARLAWRVAWDALSDEVIDRVLARGGAPWATATVVVARTVLTAPIEWAAVLLAHGTRVVVKHPRGEPGIVPLLAAAAAEEGLPLHATDDRSAVRGAELVVAMGTDETVADLRSSVVAARALLFGARFSVAWVTGEAGFDGVARDAALHDGRGCLSPVAVATPLPLPDAVAALGVAMARLEAEVPRGVIGAWEAARIRERRGLARVVGTVAEGPGWAVHGLPLARFAPAALPRVVAVHRVPDADALRGWLTAQPALSTVGTDDPSLEVPGARVVPVGTMQRPPVERLHDGVDWLAACTRP